LVTKAARPIDGSALTAQRGAEDPSPFTLGPVIGRRAPNAAACYSVLTTTVARSNRLHDVHQAAAEDGSRCAVPSAESVAVTKDPDR
jgi:hypothetical protein